MMRSCLSYLLLSLSYVLSPAAASCADTSTPTTFSVKGVAYVKYETYPGSYDTPPNSTQLAFEVVNAANGVSTGCSLQNAEFQGQWPDDSTVWRSCIDRTLSVDGQDYPVKTSALFLWEEWKLTVNQTWDCGDEYVFDDPFS